MVPILEKFSLVGEVGVSNVRSENLLGDVTDKEQFCILSPLTGPKG